MKKYVVIALSCTGIGVKVYHSQQEVPENGFEPGSIPDLIKGGFIKEVEDETPKQRAAREKAEKAAAEKEAAEKEAAEKEAADKAAAEKTTSGSPTTDGILSKVSGEKVETNSTKK